MTSGNLPPGTPASEGNGQAWTLTPSPLMVFGIAQPVFEPSGIHLPPAASCGRGWLADGTASTSCRTCTRAEFRCRKFTSICWRVGHGITPMQDGLPSAANESQYVIAVKMIAVLSGMVRSCTGGSAQPGKRAVSSAPLSPDE